MLKVVKRKDKHSRSLCLTQTDGDVVPHIAALGVVRDGVTKDRCALACRQTTERKQNRLPYCAEGRMNNSSAVTTEEKKCAACLVGTVSWVCFAFSSCKKAMPD